MGSHIVKVLAGLALAWQSTVAAQEPAPLTQSQRDQIRIECGFAEASSVNILDARGLATPAAVINRQAGGGYLAIYGASLPNADVRLLGLILKDKCIHTADFSGSNLRGVDASGTSLRLVNFSRAELQGSDFSGASFRGVKLDEANFAGANLSDAAWIGHPESSLTSTDFRGANMRGFRFDCGITMDMTCGGNDGADFSGAMLAGADLSSFPIWGYDTFAGAHFVGTYISPRALRYLQGITPSGPTFLGSPNASTDSSSDPVTISPSEFGFLQQSAQAARVDKPSFDCAKAGNAAETFICSEYESDLRALDRQLGRIYKRALDAGKATRRDQRAWLRSRNSCDERKCLAAAYQTRQGQLMAALGAQIVLAPEATLEFDEDVLPLPTEVRSSALFARIRPALRAASMQSVKLTGREDGTVEARGTAVGGNAHLCGLDVDVAAYDPKTGWYVGTLSSGQKVELFRVWEGRMMFRYSGNMGDTPDIAGDFISCGARAGFGDLVTLGD